MGTASWEPAQTIGIQFGTMARDLLFYATKSDTPQFLGIAEYSLRTFYPYSPR